MMKVRNYYAAGTVCPFVLACIGKTSGVLERNDSTRMNELYNDGVSRKQFNQGGAGWVDIELIRLRAEFWKFNIVVEIIFVPHCSYGSLTLKFHLLEPLREVVELPE